MFKKSISLMLGLVLFFTCSLGVFAANEVKASLRQDCTIFIDEKETTLKDSKGNILYPIKHDGTTYLPTSAVKGADGKSISWAAKNDAKLSAKSIEVTLLQDYKLIVDGKEKTHKNSKGNILYPIKYNGVVYLTAKTIEEATGKTVIVESKGRRIEIKSLGEKAINKTESKEIKVNNSLNYSRNENATISITGLPNTQYSIAVYYNSGKSTAAGLVNKTSDANGHVSWTWKIGSKTNPGTYRAVITGGGETKTMHFTVK